MKKQAPSGTGTRTRNKKRDNSLKNPSQLSKSAEFGNCYLHFDVIVLVNFQNQQNLVFLSNMLSATTPAVKFWSDFASCVSSLCASKWDSFSCLNFQNFDLFLISLPYDHNAAISIPDERKEAKTNKGRKPNKPFAVPFRSLSCFTLFFSPVKSQRTSSFCTPEQHPP